MAYGTDVINQIKKLDKKYTRTRIIQT
jgi:hypothetical protein